MSGLKKTAATLAALVGRYRGLITGVAIYRIGGWIFDNPLWMWAEFRWQQRGVAVMMAIAFIINTLLLVTFRNRKTDFILWNALDSVSEKQSEYHETYREWGKKKTPFKFYLLLVTYIPVKLAIFLLWCLKKSPKLGDVAAFLILPIIEDPFITTMYLRHGHENGLRKKDYAVYFLSSVISIGYWAIRNAAVVELIIRPAVKLF